MIQAIVTGIQTKAVRSLLVAQGLSLVHPDTDLHDQQALLSSASLNAQAYSVPNSSHIPETIMEQGLIKGSE